jgi:hypothetical protein
MSATVAFRELADNAFDADARRVEFTWNATRRTLTVTDDGNGSDQPEAIVTPYRHFHSSTTQSGRFGIGGTVAQVWMTEGQGKTKVATITKDTCSQIIADFDAMIKTDTFDAEWGKETNEGEPTGTSIELSRCVELKQSDFMKINTELAFCFAPALRHGREIIINGKSLAPYDPPEYDERLDFEFEVDDLPVQGFCCLVKQGIKNPAKGWAIAYGHRFMDVKRDPASPRNVDLSRFYSEVRLPVDWNNLNDHKTDFVREPLELWEKLAEACAPILDRIQEEAVEYEIQESTRSAQERLDKLTERCSAGAKGKREPTGEKSGTQEPTGAGATHTQFSKSQPGNKNPVRANKIKLTWESLDDVLYTINNVSKCIWVVLNRDAPSHKKYQESGAGDFLCDYVICHLAADIHAHSEKYKNTFKEFASTQIEGILSDIIARISKGHAS